MWASEGQRWIISIRIVYVRGVIYGDDEGEAGAFAEVACRGGVGWRREENRSAA